jgi:hypothetical protein
MGHGTIKAVTLQTVLKLIIERYDISEDQALRMFYESDTGASYADDDTGLYGQSAIYVFNLFTDEREERAVR